METRARTKRQLLAPLIASPSGAVVDDFNTSVSVSVSAPIAPPASRSSRRLSGAAFKRPRIEENVPGGADKLHGQGSISTNERTGLSASQSTIPVTRQLNTDPERDGYKKLFEEEQAIRIKLTEDKRKLERRVKDLQTTARNVKNERKASAQAKGRVETLEGKVKELEKKVKASEEDTKQAKVEGFLQNLTELEECIICNICMLKIWYPATIQECGHTFCETCLHEWFNKAYVQHIETHPEFLEERMGPQPSFVCPTCMGQVKSRPVEIFLLKEVVRKVASALPEKLRESSPGLARPSKEVGTIWDGFFPESK